MSDSTPPRRRYDGSRRRAQAESTQRDIVRVAHDLFVDNGYGATTMADIASAAGVAVPTVYANFPSKADVLRRAIEVAMAGDDEPVAVADRPTAKWVADADDATELMRRYAVMCGEVASRSGRIFAVLGAAADGDPALAELGDTLERQRLTAARRMATAVRDRGGLANGVSVEAARDVVWMANSPEVYLLAVKRGWSLERYVGFVGDILLRLVAVPARILTPTELSGSSHEG